MAAPLLVVPKALLNHLRTCRQQHLWAYKRSAANDLVVGIIVQHTHVGELVSAHLCTSPEKILSIRLLERASAS